MVVCAGGLTFFLHEQHRLKQAVLEGGHKNSLLCTDQLLELGLGASTRASTKPRTGLGLGIGLTVGLEIVLVCIISVDSLGHGRGVCGAKSIQFGWGKVQLICHDSKLSTISRG